MEAMPPVETKETLEGDTYAPGLSDSVTPAATYGAKAAPSASNSSVCCGRVGLVGHMQSSVGDKRVRAHEYVRR